MRTFYEWALSLNESMSVYVGGYDHRDDIHDLDDLSNQLKRKIIYPIFDKLPPDQQKDIESSGTYPQDVIAPDGSYYNDGNQVINFYTAGWIDQLPKIINGIKYFLKEFNIDYGQFRTEKSGMFKGDVIRIPITNFNKTKNAAPTLNLSNDNASLIFNQLLGFPKDSSHGGFSDISPADLYRKIEDIDDDLLDVHARDAYSTKSPDDSNLNTVFHGKLDKDDIKLRLDQIKKIAKWAMDNHYDDIYVV